MICRSTVIRGYYLLKPFIPRWAQIFVRRRIVALQKLAYAQTWPIDESTATPPPGWGGWPGGKKFALVLTHDVENVQGQDRCRKLAALEAGLGFRSSFNFVPERYPCDPVLREELKEQGFEIGVHGLLHDGRYFHSLENFQARATKINGYLQAWGAVGFRAPSMLHNLAWIHHLKILYDLSTFDNDPFEPQPDGVGTIFPFLVGTPEGASCFVELPYTLPQDFTLFVIMKEKGIGTWKKKLDWVAERGGMALLNTHPDYMAFDGEEPGRERYPAELYREFLEYARRTYPDAYWHVLPRTLAQQVLNRGMECGGSHGK